MGIDVRRQPNSSPNADFKMCLEEKPVAIIWLIHSGISQADRIFEQ